MQTVTEPLVDIDEAEGGGEAQPGAGAGGEPVATSSEETTNLSGYQPGFA
jgi:hypothetical protein